MSSVNESEADLLDCPEFANDTEVMIEEFAYWTEGVLLCVIAIPGILGNTLSSYILSGKSMRNSFNILLIALAAFDNTYLFNSTLESFRKRFGMYTDVQLLLFPYFLYPIHMMAMTGSILITVAIALERYMAVHFPIDYSRVANDPAAVRKRVCTYLIPVTVFSVLFNVTKFFEICHAYVPSSNVTTAVGNQSDGLHNHSTPEFTLILNITEFRTNPTYSIYFNWARFIILGVIPFALLIFFNTKIYGHMSTRRERKLARSQAAPASHHIRRSSYLPSSQPPKVTEVVDKCSSGSDQNNANNARTATVSADVHHLHVDHVHRRVHQQTSANRECPATAAPEDIPMGRIEAEDGQQSSEVIQKAAEESPGRIAIRIEESSSVRPSGNCGGVNSRVENNLALIMMGYVLVFLVCHLPRLLLNIHELATIRNAMACRQNGRKQFPAWSIIVMHISHLLLVLNSSINILIYCCLSSKFRHEGKMVLVKMKNAFRIR